MVTLRTARRVFLGRDVAFAYAVVVALYLVRLVEFQPLQIPAYLLIVAYDVVEVLVPILTPYHPIGFPLFLYLISIVGAAVARRLRSDERSESDWLQSAGGICLVIGTLSLVFGAFVGGPIIAPSDNPTPLAITGTTGITLLVVGWWLLGRPAMRTRAREAH